MATLQNSGTLLFTPALGEQSAVVSNTTVTDLSVDYGLEVAHGASPTTFAVGDEITYTVLLRNTGSGTLILPTVTVDLGGDALDYVEGSATAFLYDGADAVAYPFTVSYGSVIFRFSEPLPGGNTVILTYRATVNATAGDTVTSTATGSAAEGVATGTVISDSDTATILRTPVTVVKSAPPVAGVGDSIRFRFTVTNNTADTVTVDRLTDQLPAQFSLTAVTLTAADGTETTLTEGTDYTVSESGLLTVDPAVTLSLLAGETVILSVLGVITA